MEGAASHAHSPRAIIDFIGDYRRMIECDGIAVWSEDDITLEGETPTENEVKDLIGFIDRTSPGRICASAEIAKVYAAGKSFWDRTAGFLAIPISRTPRDCLIFFRREVLRSVNWAGDPNKSTQKGHLARGSPRARASSCGRRRLRASPDRGRRPTSTSPKRFALRFWR